MQIWYVYLVRCSDNSLYCGATTDIYRRLAAHNAGKGAKYTRAHLPVALECWRAFSTKRKALSAEYKIKRVLSHKKIALLSQLAQDDMVLNLKSEE